MTRLEFTVLQDSWSGSFCDAGLKNEETALPFQIRYRECGETRDLLVVDDSTFRLVGGGDRSPLA